MDQLNTMLKPRCQELLDSIQQEDLTAAHFNLNLGCKMTITSTKVGALFNAVWRFKIIIHILSIVLVAHGQSVRSPATCFASTNFTRNT